MNFRKLRRFWKKGFWLLYRPFYLLNRTIGYLIRAIFQYWASRRFRFFLFGLPALSALLVSTYVAASCLLQAPEVVLEQYNSAGRSALDNDQYAAARLFLQRAVELGLQDKETLFDLARTAEKTEDFVRMHSIMQQLAPEQRPVHAPAHLWKATQLLSQKEKTQEDLKRIIEQLGHVLTIRPKDGNAHTLLGEMYLQMFLYRDAVPHLEAVIEKRPQLSLSLAKAYRYSKEPTKAISAGEAAETFFSRISIESPYNHKARLQWSDSLLFLERYQESAQVLNDGIKLEDNKQFRFGLARIYVYWSDSIEMKTAKERQHKFQLLTAGLQANPNEMMIFDRLMPILAFDDKTAEQAKQFLLDNISSGHATGLCHLILGSNAFLEEKVELSEFHLERAIKQMPTAPIVANNLAWYLTFADNPNYKRAMSLIEPVLKQYPNVHEYRETRGQIYLRMGEWKKAVNDLEYALPKYQKNLQTHDALAVAYEKLGSQDLADQHRKLSNWLQENQQKLDLGSKK